MAATRHDHNKKKAVVAGHICLDITPVFPAGQKKELGELLAPGKLVNVQGAEISTGGAVANTGLAMKILGADVSLAAKIGKDAFGDIILGLLKKYGADQDMIVSPEVGTSYTVVIAVPGSDRIFLHDPGANDTFTGADISDDMLRGASLIHFGYPPLMRSMYINYGEELVSLFRRAKEFGVATSLDMAAVDPASDAGKVDWEKVLERVLPYTDIFAPSIEEIIFMVDRNKYDILQSRSAGNDITLRLSVEEDVKPVADTLADLGAKIILLKCGVAGMYLHTAGSAALSDVGPKISPDMDEWSNKRIFEPSYKPEKVLSATGAGDTSIAAFLTALLEGRGPKECIRLAAAAGACCVTAYDALSGLKSIEEMTAKISSGWEKIY